VGRKDEHTAKCNYSGLKFRMEIDKKKNATTGAPDSSKWEMSHLRIVASPCG